MRLRVVNNDLGVVGDDGDGDAAVAEGHSSWDSPPTVNGFKSPDSGGFLDPQEGSDALEEKFPWYAFGLRASGIRKSRCRNRLSRLAVSLALQLMHMYCGYVIWVECMGYSRILGLTYGEDGV